MTRTRALIQSVLTRFYVIHHNKDTFETELVEEVNNARVRAFGEAKQRVVEAIDHRLDKYLAESCFENGHNTGIRNELEKIRHHVKGMVVKVEE